jgi:predicted nucleic acid-binding protein
VILVDSSVWINWLKARQSPAERLEPWIRAGIIISCGPIRAEVIRGIRDARVKARIEELFFLIPEINLDRSLWQEVSEEIWTLDRAGRVLPLIDVVIAIAARRHNATVISTDPHFQQIPNLRVETQLPTIARA